MNTKMSSLFGASDYVWILIFVIFLIPASKSDCPGLSAESSQHMDCTSNGKPKDCQGNFSVKSSLKYHCKPNYKLEGTNVLGGTNWNEAICQQNNKWSCSLKNIRCKIDYGKLPELGPVVLIMGSRKRQKDFPWHVAIFSIEEPNSAPTYQCGGTLIDELFVLTAAHCTYRDDYGKKPYQDFELKVVLAPSSGTFADNVGEPSQTAQVSKIIRYDGGEYKGELDNHKYDLVMLMLSLPAQISDFISPVRLPSLYETSETMILQVNGYGATSDDGPASDILYGMDVSSNSSECMNNPRTADIAYSDIQFCTTPTNPATGICKGDSGGGAFKLGADNKWSIQGIVSFGVPRGEVFHERQCFYLVVFTKIAYGPYLAWILSVLYGRNPCKYVVRTPDEITPQTKPSDSQCLQDANQVATNLHNDYRHRHGSPPVIFDRDIAKEAERVATYILANNQIPQQPSPHSFGRNIYNYTGNTLSCTEAASQAVSNWYNDINKYDWNSPLSSPNSWTFSQVVWKSSQRLGVGVAIKDGRSVVVAFYSPGGNIQDAKDYAENVLPLNYNNAVKFL